MRIAQHSKDPGYALYTLLINYGAAIDIYIDGKKLTNQDDPVFGVDTEKQTVMRPVMNEQGRIQTDPNSPLDILCEEVPANVRVEVVPAQLLTEAEEELKRAKASRSKQTETPAAKRTKKAPKKQPAKKRTPAKKPTKAPTRKPAAKKTKAKTRTIK